MLRNGNSGLKMGVSRAAAHTQYAYIYMEVPPPPPWIPWQQLGYFGLERKLLLHVAPVYCFTMVFNHSSSPWQPTKLLPSKLPCVTAHCNKPLYVSSEGLKTKTPELKQSGHPTSGAADNSSLSNRSSTFLSI